MKKIKLIYNSGAGQSKFTYFLDPIIEKFMDNNVEVSVFRAGENTNLYEYLKDAEQEGIYGVVVAGGDGTINRVVNVMIKNKINVPLGIIPAGTSNDFARHIKMPNNFSECIDKILTGNVQEVDVGLANDKYFINVCSAGLFTNASQKADKNLKNAIGKLSYFVTAADQLFKFKPFDVRVETKNKVFEDKINLFLIFNGSSVGGIDKFTDNSSIQDGLLDILIIKNCNLGEVGRIVNKIFVSNILEDENLIYLKEDYVKITKLKGKVDAPDVDGEEGPKFPLEVTCVKKGIRLFL